MNTNPKLSNEYEPKIQYIAKRILVASFVHNVEQKFSNANEPKIQHITKRIWVASFIK